MRITQKTLLRIAQDTVNNRVKADRTLLAAYLHGVLVTQDEPLLGGTADIDIVLVHDLDVPAPRELIRLTDDVHLDIVHHVRSQYRQPRTLRTDPVYGPLLYGCKLLHDPRHFIDLTQASVRDQFFAAPNVYARANSFLKAARDTWFQYQMEPPTGGLGSVRTYLKAVENAAQAVASMNGAPLSERRMLLDFPKRAAAFGNPGLTAGLIGLLGGAQVQDTEWDAWLAAWDVTYHALTEVPNAPLSLHAERYPYYRRAFDALLGSSEPLAVLYPLLNTWLTACDALPDGHPQRGSWKLVGDALGFTGEALFSRLDALDMYLDAIEELFETWAQANGLDF
jgi:hypothetical protein